MKGSIYGIVKLYKPETIKIGSTMNFTNRIYGYLTPEADFNNSSHAIWRYKILRSKWNCYEIDILIQNSSKKFNHPFVWYQGTGGTEHYKYTDVKHLSSFLDELDITYIFEKIDVDKLRNDMKLGKNKEKIKSKKN